MIFNAHIEGGRLKIDTEEKWKKFLLGFDEGTPLSVDVEKKKNRRSISQNKFYWLYLGVIEDETGNDASDLHELFKRKFLPFQTKTVLGQEIRLTSTTTELSKYDFSEYMEKICALTGVPIPDPELAGYTSNHKQLLTKPTVAYPQGESKTEFD